MTLRPLATAMALLASAAPREPARADDAPALVRLTLRDGQIVVGRVVAEEGSRVVLDIAGSRIEIPADAIVARDEERRLALDSRGELAPRTAMRTRYLHAPSAATLDRGEGWISQEELVLTTAAVGATSWLTVGAGAVLPWYFSGEDGLNYWAMARVGARLGRDVRIALHGETYRLPIFDPFAMAAGVVTFERERWQVSGAVGRLWKIRRGAPPLESDLATILAGSVRVGRRWSLVTEHWLLTGAAKWTLIGAGAVRFEPAPLSIDVGVLGVPVTRLPVPWVAIAYTF